MIPADVRAYFVRHPSTLTGFIWRWNNFTFEEIECRDGTGALIVPIALDRLQLLRDMLGEPVYVSSAYRSIAYNKQVEGSPNSFHLSGMAFDIHCEIASLDLIAKRAGEAGFTGIGRYGTFVHVDIGPLRSWAG